jgi:D-aspartate ligase
MTIDRGLPLEAPAIVLGLDLNGLGVVRALGRAGIPVIGVDHLKGHAGRASRYCGTVIDANPCSSDDLIRCLQDLGSRLAHDGVIFPTMDDSVRILSQRRSELPPNLKLSLPSPDTVTRLMEKEDLAALAEQHGWPAPFTTICTDAAEVAEAARRFPFPGVMKPGRRELAAPRGIPQKLWAFEDPRQLVDAYDVLSRWERRVILQEIVAGPDSAVAFCLFYADRTAQPRALFVGRKIRQYPPLYGSTSSAAPAHDDRVRSFAERFIRDVNFQGLGSVEMKIHARTGEPLLIEPTVGRTDYQSFLAVANGVNIPEVAFRDLMGLPTRQRPPSARAVKYLVARSDWRSARLQIRDGRETWRGYLRSLRGRKAYALLQGGDPRPLFYAIHYATTGRAIRVLKRVVRSARLALTGCG